MSWLNDLLSKGQNFNDKAFNLAWDKGILPKWSKPGGFAGDYQQHLFKTSISGDPGLGYFKDYFSARNRGESKGEAYGDVGQNALTSAAILALILGGGELASGGGEAGSGAGEAGTDLTQPLFSSSSDLSSGLSGLDGSSAMGASGGEWSSGLGTGSINSGAGSSSLFANAADLGQGLGTAEGGGSFLDNFNTKGFLKQGLGAMGKAMNGGGSGSGSSSGGSGSELEASIPAQVLEVAHPSMLGNLFGGTEGPQSPYAKALISALLQDQASGKSFYDFTQDAQNG